MRLDELKERVELPEGVSASISGDSITIKGPKGELVKKTHVKNIVFELVDGGILISAFGATKREKKLLFTFRSIIRNMIKGVTQGHEYKLKICSGHFPMNVAVKGREFEVKNFIGESVPRRLKLKEGVDIKVNGDIIIVSGIDKGLVSQSAADIEGLTRRPGFDNRIFQDGIYIIEKDGKVL